MIEEQDQEHEETGGQNMNRTSAAEQRNWSWETKYRKEAGIIEHR